MVALLESLLVEGVKGFGIDLDEKQLELFNKFYQLVIDANKKFNLTSIIEPADFAIKHIIDSLSIYKVFDFRSGEPSIIDIGCGAGFPGIPLKIAFPNIKLTLMDATKKKTDFIKRTVTELGISAEVLWGRAEDLALHHREKYDVVVARAVSLLPALIEICLPYNKVGGIFIAQKSDDSELESAKNALKILGGEISSVHNFLLPRGEKRALIVIKKLKSAPIIYPRSAGIPAKNPL